MEHKLKAIEHRELNDDQVSVLYRCCDDPTTDSWCTVHLSLSATEIEAVFEHHKGKIALQHENKLRFRAGSHPVNQHTGDSTLIL
jgi:hypothetical protein